MECDISIENNSFIVTSASKGQPLRMDFSKSYCRLFETSHDQSRDYIEEVVRWCGGYPTNFDKFSKNLMLHTAARRKQFGFEK